MSIAEMSEGPRSVGAPQPVTQAVAKEIPEMDLVAFDKSIKALLSRFSGIKTSLQDRLETAEADVLAAERELQKLEGELVALKGAVESKAGEVQKLNDKINNLPAEIAALDEALKELPAKKDEARKTREDFMIEVREQKTLMENAKRAFEAAREVISKIDPHDEEQPIKFEAQRKATLAFVEAYKDKQARLKALDEEFEQASQNLSDRQADRAQRDRELSESKKSLEDARSALNEAQKQHAAKEKEVETARAKKEELKDPAELSEQIGSVQAAMVLLEQLLRKLSAAKTHEQHLIGLEDNLSDGSSEIHNLFADITEAAVGVTKRLHEVAMTKGAEAATLEAARGNQEESSLAARGNLSFVCRDLTSALQTLLAESASKDLDAEGDVAAWSAIAKAEAELSRLLANMHKDARTEQVRRFDDLHSRITHTRERIKADFEAFDATRVDLAVQNATQGLQEELEDARAALEELRAEGATESTEKIRLNAEVDRLTGLVDAREAEIIKLQEGNARHASHIENLNAEKARLEVRLREVETDEAGKAARIASLERTVAALESKMPGEHASLDDIVDEEEGDLLDGEQKTRVGPPPQEVKEELWRKRYDGVGDFHDGVAIVKKGEEWFHIGKDGQPLYAERYDYVEIFHDGAARVRKGEKYFHIGKDGQPLYAERYDYVRDFHYGAAVVKKGEERFHIGEDGKPLYAERYDDVSDFYDGAARVEKGGKQFHIGKDGKALYAERYDGVSDFQDGVAVVEKGGKWFQIGKDGKPLLHGEQKTRVGPPPTAAAPEPALMERRPPRRR